MKRKLVATIACRNFGQRLFAKPLQNLDLKKNINVLNLLIKNIRKQKSISQIVLGIAKEKGSEIYKEFAKKNHLEFIVGDEKDVLSRLIKCAELVKATDVFRVTSESPFPYLNNLKKSWHIHKKENLDAIFLDDVIDGCGYEIIKLSALRHSHKFGKKRHRSELCTLYIRDNIINFKVKKIKPPKFLLRKDLRLTVDYPEDLILCREIYKEFLNKKINHKKIVEFVDKNKYLKNLVKKYTVDGYKLMYK